MSNKTCKKILGVLAEKEMSESEIASELGIALNTVGYNIKKLVSAGLIEKVGGFLWSVRGKRIHKYKLSNKKIVISPKVTMRAVVPIVVVLALLTVMLVTLNLPQNPAVFEGEFKQFNSFNELKSFVKKNSETNGGFFDNIFVNGDKLIVFASGFARNEEGVKCFGSEVPGVKCGNYGGGRNLIYIYDISDRANPELEKEISADGNYVNARMIGNYVYVVSSKYVNVVDPEPPVFIDNGIETAVKAEEVYYFDYPDTNYVFTSIMAIDIDNGDFESKVYLTGSSRIIFVSEENIYLSYQKRGDYEFYAEDFAENVALKVLPGKYKEDVGDILDSGKNGYRKVKAMRDLVFDYSASLKGSEKADFDEQLMELMREFEIEVQKEMEKTVVHKIGIDEMDIEYKGVGEVPGKILNQFAMDEYDDYFRIATTTGQWGETSLNHIYILDKDLKIVGSVDDLAEGEKIFSVRFMGERAYLVTFEAIDPFFVIDLSDPEKPEVLGYLKIPGYSDYLHPYDEDYVIGIGKDVDASIDADKIHSSHAVYYTAVLGVKVSLFDVSDVENPIETAKIVIGDRGTESEVLRDHKAFLFDKEKDILVLPITVVERDKSLNEEVSTWMGAYVLDVNLEKISVKGKITHVKGDNYYDWTKMIKRTLYMDDVLYTVSDKIIKANDLDTIEEIGFVEL